ncbi:MAG: hypothetical protein EA381_07695 [Planctomycetaceae bacterium]|nr:MAG: hypothetical protein EA381_07695 [Planctomycetaceae bacterium]
MNAPASSNDPWVIFDYEVGMFRSMCQLLMDGNVEYQSLPIAIKFAVVESAVLHTRILVDILLSRGSESDDIKLSALAPTFTCSEIDQLRQSYGGRKEKNSPCWIFNKKLAHATDQRSDRCNYSAQLNRLAPLINNIVNQVTTQRHSCK